MKALIKILAVALFLTGAIQVLKAQDIGLGVRGGVNIATAEIEMKIDDSWETDMKDYIVGVNAGLVAEIGFSDMFALQPELNFIQKGYKTTYQNGFTYDATTTLNYLEMPVLLKGRFGAGDLKFNAVLGPSVGYAFNGKHKANGETTDIDFDTDNVNRYDFSGVVGLGASYDLTVGSIFLDGRMAWGFANVYDGEGSDNFNWHNRGFNIGAGYIYHFGR